MNKIERFAAIVERMKETYRRKNAAYGDSFGISVEKYGYISALTRMSDKWNRLETLMLNKVSNEVDDERLEDTLLDLACYCVMTLIELEGDREEIGE